MTTLATDKITVFSSIIFAKPRKTFFSEFFSFFFAFYFTHFEKFRNKKTAKKFVLWCVSREITIDGKNFAIDFLSPTQRTVTFSNFIFLAVLVPSFVFVFLSFRFCVSLRLSPVQLKITDTTATCASQDWKINFKALPVSNTYII